MAESNGEQWSTSAPASQSANYWCFDDQIDRGSACCLRLGGRVGPTVRNDMCVHPPDGPLPPDRTEDWRMPLRSPSS
jgi:hypothetical protein